MAACGQLTKIKSMNCSSTLVMLISVHKDSSISIRNELDTQGVSK
jgi:hypothetical protein